MAIAIRRSAERVEAGDTIFWLLRFTICHLFTVWFNLQDWTSQLELWILSFRGALATRNLYDFSCFKISPFGRNDIIDSFSKLSTWPFSPPLNHYRFLKMGTFCWFNLHIVNPTPTFPILSFRRKLESRENLDAPVSSPAWREGDLDLLKWGFMVCKK